MACLVVADIRLRFFWKGQRKVLSGIFSRRTQGCRLQVSALHLQVNRLSHFLQQAVVDDAVSGLLPDDGVCQLKPDVLSQLLRLLDCQHGRLQGLLAPCNHNLCHLCCYKQNLFNVSEVRGQTLTTCFAVQLITSYRNAYWLEIITIARIIQTAALKWWWLPWNGDKGSVLLVSSCSLAYMWNWAQPVASLCKFAFDQN